MNPVQLQSMLACPYCGNRKTETMPADARQFFHECEACHRRFKSKPGDCCVCCSYGSVPYPPIQQSGNTARRLDPA